VLYSFKGGADGSVPTSSVVRDAAGNLYGTTFYGGNATCLDGCGTVFKVDATGKETVLYRFTGGADGSAPNAGLIRDNAGNLYGTTGSGFPLTCSSASCGTVFKLDATGVETVLHTFTGPPDGSAPEAVLVRDANGNLYGTTLYGGDVSNCGLGCGTVFKLDSSGNETVLYSFIDAADGGLPSAGVIRDGAGNLFGTTVGGGASNSGTLYKIDATGKETVLYSFTGGADGGSPFAGLVAVGAKVYGTTGSGGAYGYGTVFKVDKVNKSGKETVLYSFTGGADGYNPSAGLVRDAAGNLYGTTSGGGFSNYGTVYKIDATGKRTLLYSFTGGADGQHPFAGLIRDAAGNLYGTAEFGGAFGLGTVFKLAP